MDGGASLYNNAENIIIINLHTGEGDLEEREREREGVKIANIRTNNLHPVQSTTARRIDRAQSFLSIYL